MTDAVMQSEIHVLFRRKRIMALALPFMVLAYLAYVVWTFDVVGLMQRAEPGRAQTLLADSYSYKTHITRSNRTGDWDAAIEGERKGKYDEGVFPAWAVLNDTGMTIALNHGHEVTVSPEGEMRYDVPGFGLITALPTRRGIETNLTPETAPDWVNMSNTRLSITTRGGRVNVTKSKTEVFRYFTGWELFFFTLDSPYHGHSVTEILFGDQIDPTRGNVAGALHDFWMNPMWHHHQVAWAMFETILMAFLGTMGAGLIALPLAFFAARGFNPLRSTRFALRRVFDFLRGVDGLIWTILLSRAFGPGPLTGSLAIMLTDTGTFGKLFSEALENTDKKQIEGIQSTGANRLQRYRFGVLPQLMPVLLSQILYYLESNTRSATIIGAITGGGIGLLLTQAMITHKDWEEVTYYIILVVLMVMMMDWLSGWLRRKLIKGG
ncbi:MAG: phosphonate ABC transporter, permease protein PhnE [Rhodovulum sp.]|nr:phosphonate ABC transporter, permease protein PhnE [Rhodovulum sp.]MCI5084608.1 phosphonate ABC transporter, permease protein PhnE [Rhodovulum sp.]